jgi:hypothetical protein
MAAPHSAMARRQGRFTPVFAGYGRVLMAPCALEHDPEKPAPDLIRGVQRFSEKIMLKQEAKAG